MLPVTDDRSGRLEDAVRRVPHYKSPDWWSADFYRPDRADTMMKEMAGSGRGERAEAKALTARPETRRALHPASPRDNRRLEPVQFEPAEPHPLQRVTSWTNGVEDAAHLPVLSSCSSTIRCDSRAELFLNTACVTGSCATAAGVSAPRTVTA